MCISKDFKVISVFSEPWSIPRAMEIRENPEIRWRWIREKYGQYISVTRHSPGLCIYFQSGEGYFHISRALKLSRSDGNRHNMVMKFLENQKSLLLIFLDKKLFPKALCVFPRIFRLIPYFRTWENSTVWRSLSPLTFSSSRPVAKAEIFMSHIYTRYRWIMISPVLSEDLVQS